MALIDYATLTLVTMDFMKDVHLIAIVTTRVFLLKVLMTVLRNAKIVRNVVCGLVDPGVPMAISVILTLATMDFANHVIRSTIATQQAFQIRAHTDIVVIANEGATRICHLMYILYTNELKMDLITEF